jgi:hypothetical protein
VTFILDLKKNLSKSFSYFKIQNLAIGVLVRQLTWKWFTMLNKRKQSKTGIDLNPGRISGEFQPSSLKNIISKVIRLP